MKRALFVLLVVIALLAACAPAAQPSPTTATTSSTKPAETTAAPAVQPTQKTQAPAAQPAASVTFTPVKLRFHSFTGPPPAMHGVGPKWFMDEVTKRTNGAVTFETFWSGSLADPAGQLDLVSSGAVDLELSCVTYWPTKFPFGAFEYAIPFGPIDPVLVTKANRQLFKEFPIRNAEYEKNNVVLVSNLSAPYYELLSRTPVKTLEDLRGKKVATVGRYLGKWFQPIGALPVALPGGERYTSLQAGVVDVDATVIEAQYVWKLHEVAKNQILVGLGTMQGAQVMMNSNSFKKLQPEVQKVIMEVGEEAEMYLAKAFVAKRDEILEAIKGKGVTVTTLDAAERQKWIDAIPDTGAEWAKEVEASGPSWVVAKRWQEVTSELGYKWGSQWAVKN